MITPESKENNYFTKTSDGQYDRHKYKINCKDCSSVITYDYNDVIENYWHKHQLIENNLDASFVQQTEGLTYVRFTVEEDNDEQ